MKKTLVLVLFGLFTVGLVHAQSPADPVDPTRPIPDPISIFFPTPTPPPTPTPAPAGGGVWIKLPVTFASVHPLSRAGCNNVSSQTYPINFPGATSIKIIVSKALFDNIHNDGVLTVRDATGSTVKNIPGTDATKSYEVIVPGSQASIYWYCYLYTTISLDFGYTIDEIYASFQ